MYTKQVPAKLAPVIEDAYSDSARTRHLHHLFHHNLQKNYGAVVCFVKYKMEKMAALKKNQLHSILSKWCHQMLSSRLQNYSTSARMSNNSTSSDQNFEPPSKERNGNDSYNGEPTLPGSLDCCNKGCSNCVWLEYVIRVEFHYKHNKAKLLEAINCIPVPATRAFVEFELKKILTGKREFPDSKKELKLKCDDS